MNKQYQTEEFDNIYQVIFVDDQSSYYETESASVAIINMIAESEKDCWDQICEWFKKDLLDYYLTENDILPAVGVSHFNYLSTTLISLGEKFEFRPDKNHRYEAIEVEITKLKILYG